MHIQTCQSCQNNSIFFFNFGAEKNENKIKITTKIVKSKFKSIQDKNDEKSVQKIRNRLIENVEKDSQRTVYEILRSI